MMDLLVFAAKFKFVSGSVVSASIVQSGCDDNAFAALKDGAINDSLLDTAGATRRDY